MNKNESVNNQTKVIPVNHWDNPYLLTSYHPYNKQPQTKPNDNEPKSNYPVSVNSNINPENQWSNPNEAAPKLSVNGGLYSGPQSNAIGVPKPVVPTTTYFMQELLKKMDPPPPQGAAEQYSNYNRPGNNFVAMPNVYWYNPQDKGPYRIKVIDKSN